METPKSSARRRFVKQAGAALIGGVGATSGLAACSAEAPSEQAGVAKSFNIGKKRYEWRCVTTWPPNFPVLGEAVVNMARDLDTLSAGRLKVKVYGGNELVPALECFDAVTQGGVQMAHGASYYWAGKLPSAVFFSAIPFGMNAQQMNAWMLHGDGWKLWQELYGEFGLMPFPCGNTGVQMGGWFNKEINTVADLQGLKMRIPGLGGKVLARAGGSAMTIAGGELYTNLERGVIDATEWIGPYHDYIMGFHQIAQYYYYPGWHEPGTVLEFMVNKKALESLPKDLQEMVSQTCMKYNLWVLSEFEAKNNIYLQKILDESNVDLRKFPDEVLFSLKKYADEVIGDITAADPFAEKVYQSFMSFKKQIVNWSQTSERAMAAYFS